MRSTKLYLPWSSSCFESFKKAVSIQLLSDMGLVSTPLVAPPFKLKSLLMLLPELFSCDILDTNVEIIKVLVLMKDTV